jgi:hypothetical protein
MTDYQQWAARFPEAAEAFAQMVDAADWNGESEAQGRSEAWAQQQARFDIARQGALAWRNNVGATKAKCEHCGQKVQPVRYGLANDSAQLNAAIKSSDLILGIPRRIGILDVGRTILQFGSVECKPPGWRFTGSGREGPQAAWLNLILKNGGFACFSTGKVEL